MPFCPSALDERTLKQFVDRTLRLRREQACPTPATWPPKRAQIQEEVALTLGFPHWHAARAAVRSKAEPPAPLAPPPTSPSESGQVGAFVPWFECPWSEGVLTFAVFEAVLAWAAGMGATDVILNPKGELILRVNEVFETHPGRPVLGDERKAIVRGLMEGALPRKSRSMAHQVNHPRYGQSRLRVLVVTPGVGAASDAWAIQCQPIALESPTWASLGVDPQVAHRLTHARSGLVLVASPDRNGTTEVLRGIVHARAAADVPGSADPHPAHAAVASPAHLQEIREDVSGVTPTSLAVRMAMSMDPHALVISGLDADEAWDKVFMHVQKGHLVLSTMQATGVGPMLEALFRRTPSADARVGLVRGLNTLVVQRRLSLMTGVPGTIREYLVVDDVARLALLSAPASEVAQVAERLMESRQSNFRWAATRAFSRGQLDPITFDSFATTSVDH